MDAASGPASAPASRLPRSAGVAMVAGGAVSLQLGSAVAALLFPRTGPLGMVTLRLVVAAVVLLVVCRPRIRGHSRADWAVVCGFGAALAGLNTLFYQALDRLPLGTVVTLEVLGPLALSVLASRRVASLLWAALALCGVFLLGRGGFDRLDPAGVGFALAAGVLWAGYILLGARTGRRFPRADGLAIAMAVGALLALPFGAGQARVALTDPVLFGLAASVALLSSVLPYTLELLALRSLPEAAFAVLLSLEPAVAALAGYLVLGQELTLTDGLAIALVVAASAGAVGMPDRRDRARDRVRGSLRRRLRGCGGEHGGSGGEQSGSGGEQDGSGRDHGDSGRHQSDSGRDRGGLAASPAGGSPENASPENVSPENASPEDGAPELGAPAARDRGEKSCRHA